MLAAGQAGPLYGENMPEVTFCQLIPMYYFIFSMSLELCELMQCFDSVSVLQVLCPVMFFCCFPFCGANESSEKYLWHNTTIGKLYRHSHSLGFSTSTSAHLMYLFLQLHSSVQFYSLYTVPYAFTAV